VSILAVSSTRVGAATLDLWDLVGLTVSGEDQDLNTLNVEEHSFPLLRSKLWVVKISGNLILDTDGIDADTVTAVVDLDGTTGTNTASDTATCGPGPSRLTRITAICK
jgi:hypothetical protein